MELQFQQIPAVLKSRRQWVLWRYESRDGKPTKVPYATTGERASATDGATWATYDAAVAALGERGVDGIGFVFTSEDPFVGIDLDNCRDPDSGKIEPWAGAIIRRLKSYTEITPSGCGVHILCQGELPPGPRRKGPIEMYSAARYFTITGRRLGHITEVEERKDELVAVHQETFAEAPPKVNGDHPPTLADHEIVMRVTKEPGYQALWSGDFSRYPSQSEADLALCGRIAFFAGPDPSTIDRLFRQSGLMREKWDSVHHGRAGSTYGADTIQRALSSMVAFYGWKEGAARKAGAASPAGPGPAAEREDGTDPIHRTDLGNAALLVRRFGADLHWTGERGWLVWDGVRWREDKTEQVEGMACTIARLLFEEGCAQTGDEREAGIKWALRSEGRARIEAMTELAKSQPGIPISAGEFDRDPELAGHPSGKLCLGRQPAVLPSSRADRITHSIGCVVDPAAACPRWEQFLNEVMDGQTELVEFLQRAAGYSLTGHVSEQCLFFLHGAGENGKALALDTPLPTPTGWTTMGEVRVGDELFDELGHRCHVMAVTPAMTGRPCYRLRFSDGAEIIADADHQWWVNVHDQAGRRSGPVIRTTEQMARDNDPPADCAFKYSVPVAGPLGIGCTELPIDPYVLGAWLGDGHSASAHLTNPDPEVIETIRAAGVSAEERVSGSCPTYILGRRPVGGDNPSLQSQLRRLDLLGNKHIPAAYLRASLTQRLALLQGLMDTDGFAAPDHGQCEFTTILPSLREGVMELARTLGLKPTLKTRRAMLDGRDCGEYYRIQFHAYADLPCFRLERKRARLTDRPQAKPTSGRRSIVSIEPVESVPVRCVQVDSPSRLYLAGQDMIPTHNSTLLSTLLALFGEYGMVAPPGLLLERYRDQHPTEIADLAGKRLVVSEEVGEGKRLAEELVKRLTGGLPMKGRWMNRDFFQFRPEFKLWLAANHKPEVRGTDHAIWRRIYLIPFTVRFGSLDAPPKDPRLADTLAAELPGILNWLLAGVERWQEQGLAPPDAVRAATDEYRTEMDTLGGFFAECCFLKESAQCRGGQIYEAYGAWCLRSGERPVSSKEFAQRLRERGFKSRHGHYGSVWDGIGVKEGGERAENGLFG